MSESIEQKQLWTSYIFSGAPLRGLRGKTSDG